MATKYIELQFAYVADGFADDCDELMYRCARVDILKFEYFSQIWKEMRLASIFHGRPSGAELAELSEEVIHVAKHYMVAENSNFEESVAGLFLVYALLSLQPYPGFAAVRFVKEDIPAIERLEMGARRARRHDVLYILGSVLRRGPSEFHAAARERAMEHSVRKYLEGFGAVERAGARPKGVFLRHNEESRLLQELSGLARRYSAAKAAISDKRNVNYTSDSVMEELDSSLKSLINGLIDVDEDDSDTDTELKPGLKSSRSVYSVKEKAMKSKVQPMRHLVAVDSKPKQRGPKKPDLKTSPGKIMSTPGKVKSGSPLKQIATNSPRKRKVTPKKKPARVTKDERNDVICTGLSTSESESSDDSDFSEPKKKIPHKYVAKKSKTEEPKNTEPKSDKEKKEVTEHEIDIQIDSLPCLITSEQNGKYYEIEIIDELKKTTQSDTNNEPTSSPKSKLRTMDDVTIQKVDKVEPVKGDTECANEMAKISRVRKASKIARGKVKRSKVRCSSAKRLSNL